jgi:hypothetical protein
MMAEAYGSSYCAFGLVPASKLSHRPQAHYGFILKLSHHGGKNTALRAKKVSAPPLRPS